LVLPCVGVYSILLHVFPADISDGQFLAPCSSGAFDHLAVEEAFEIFYLFIYFVFFYFVQWDIQCHVLLTGTPVQNNLGELYSLLSFIDRRQFKPNKADAFVDKYTNASRKSKFLEAAVCSLVPPQSDRLWDR
jgi:hypothetical protein